MGGHFRCALFLLDLLCAAESPIEVNVKDTGEQARRATGPVERLPAQARIGSQTRTQPHYDRPSNPDGPGYNMAPAPGQGFPHFVRSARSCSNSDALSSPAQTELPGLLGR